jgi:hypothetical protein
MRPEAMLQVRTGTTGMQKGAIKAMNTLANLYVAQHLQDLLDEAAKERLRRTARSSRPSRIGSALASLRVAVGRRPALAA